jgi:O-acetyl-ADP-ribose deacetylase (regulator of RNase III)
VLSLLLSSKSTSSNHLPFSHRIIIILLLLIITIFLYRPKTDSRTMLLRPVANFALGKGITMTIARGSVVDFAANRPNSLGAIVNAANEGCLGGGGVDGAINDAGGPNLWRDRMALPVIQGTTDIRCRTGDAVVTGPGDYNELRVPFVIHAVGPSYFRYEEDVQEGEEEFAIPDELLYSAYRQSLERCKENNITDVGFALLSAGIFRGRQSMQNVLSIGVMGIRDWINDAEDCGVLKTVTLCGFSKQEILWLMKVSKQILGAEILPIAERDIDEGSNHDEENIPLVKRKRSMATQNATVDDAAEAVKHISEDRELDEKDATEERAEKAQSDTDEDPRTEMPKDT